MSRRPYGPAASRGAPLGFDTWYDWALVYRYWHGQAATLRMPYLRERAALLKLGEQDGMTAAELGERLGFNERTIVRWRSRREGSDRRPCDGSVP